MPLPPFQRFLDEHREPVWRFLVAVAGRQEADDCLQETFLAALRACPRLESGANRRSWVFPVAHGKAIDSHRGRARRPQPADDLPEHPAPANSPAGDPELWELVLGLPPKQRAAVVLRFVAGMRHA